MFLYLFETTIEIENVLAKFEKKNFHEKLCLPLFCIFTKYYAENQGGIGLKIWGEGISNPQVAMDLFYLVQATEATKNMGCFGTALPVIVFFFFKNALPQPPSHLKAPVLSWFWEMFNFILLLISIFDVIFHFLR